MLLLLRLSAPAIDENRHLMVERIEFLTGLTDLPHFPLSLQQSGFVVGSNKLTHYWPAMSFLARHEEHLAGSAPQGSIVESVEGLLDNQSRILAKLGQSCRCV
jgi:hypothetical protein